MHNRPSLKILATVLVVVAFAAQAGAQSFFIEASRRAVVRIQPDLDAEALERLDRGDTRVCVIGADGQPVRDSGYYNVVLPDGRAGWVSRFPVRLKEGTPPSDATGGSPAPPVPLPESGESSHTAAELAGFLLEHTGAVGLPVSQTILVNEGYVLGYDPRLKIAAWVQYRLTADDFADGNTREESFREDSRLKANQQSLLSDYDPARDKSLWRALHLTGTENFYARGHMIPDKSQSRSESLQSETYVLSNMAPQVQNGFNGGTWLSLERKIREWCTARQELIVTAGPVFLSVPRQLNPLRDNGDRVAVLDTPGAEPLVEAQPPTDRQVIYNVVGASEVAVPSAFFCVVLDIRDANAPEAIAFLIHNASRTIAEGRTLESRIVSIDDIEAKTGLDLFSELPDALETSLERTVAPALWQDD